MYVDTITMLAWGPLFVGIIGLVLVVTAAIAAGVTYLLVKRQRMKNQKSVSGRFAAMGWKGWLASIVLGCGTVWAWAEISLLLTTPLRGKIIGRSTGMSRRAVYEHERFARLCAAGLVALLAILAYVIHWPNWQSPILINARLVVTGFGVAAAVYMAVMAVLSG